MEGARKMEKVYLNEIFTEGVVHRHRYGKMDICRWCYMPNEGYLLSIGWRIATRETGAVGPIAIWGRTSGVFSVPGRTDT